MVSDWDIREESSSFKALNFARYGQRCPSTFDLLNIDGTNLYQCTRAVNVRSGDSHSDKLSEQVKLDRIVR